MSDSLKNTSEQSSTVASVEAHAPEKTRQYWVYDDRLPVDLAQAVSRLADGEGSQADLDQVLAQTSAGEAARRAWARYHSVGDALRSSELLVPERASSSFAAAVMARVAQEPVIIAAPKPLPEIAASATGTYGAASASARRGWKRYALPGGAMAAAAAVVAVIGISSKSPLSLTLGAQGGLQANSTNAVQAVAVQASAGRQVPPQVLPPQPNPSAHLYMAAHQRFTPATRNINGAAIQPVSLALSD